MVVSQVDLLFANFNVSVLLSWDFEDIEVFLENPKETLFIAVASLLEVDVWAMNCVLIDRNPYIGKKLIVIDLFNNPVRRRFEPQAFVV